MLGLAYDSGTGTWRGTSGGGTLVWAGTAAGSSPSGYWGALTWIYGGITYTGTLLSYTTSTGCGSWSFASGTPGISSPVEVCQPPVAATSAPCACGTATTTATAFATTTGCTLCASGAPLTWYATFSGGTGVFAALNGTWALAYGSGCGWGHFPTYPQLQLNGAAGTWTLSTTPSSGTSATYTLAGTSWDCLGQNTMPLQTSAGSGTPPSTAVLTTS